MHIYIRIVKVSTVAGIIALLVSCQNVGFRRTMVEVGGAPSNVAAIARIISKENPPTFDQIQDAVRECVDDRDNGSDALIAFGEQGLQCYCYHQVVQAIRFTIPNYVVNPVVLDQFCGSSQSSAQADDAGEASFAVEQRTAYPTPSASHGDVVAAPPTTSTRARARTHTIQPKTDFHAVCESLGGRAQYRAKTDGVVRGRCIGLNFKMEWLDE